MLLNLKQYFIPPVRYWLLILCLFSLSIHAEETGVLGVKIAGELQADSQKSGETKPDGWELEVTVGSTSEEQTMLNGAIEGTQRDLKDNPDAPVLVVVVGEGDSAGVQGANLSNTEDRQLRLVAGSVDLPVKPVTQPSLADFGSKLSKAFKNAPMLWVNHVRPRLPISPNTPQDSNPESIRMMKVKAVLSGVSAAAVLFVFKENFDFSTEYLSKGLALTAFQVSLAMATAYRNNEFVDWIKDKSWWRSSGIKDLSAWSGYKRDAKVFSLMTALLTLSQAAAGQLGLRSAIPDPMTILTGAAVSTVIGKGWYATMAKHLKESSPWMSRIPVLAYAVANLGNIAAVVKGSPFNGVSLAAWIGLGASGLVTYQALKSKEAISQFANRLNLPRAVGAAADFCAWSLSRVKFGRH